MSKKRRERILEIIKDRQVYTQEELINILKEDGFNTAQPTISRDIRELGLIKVGKSKERSYYVKVNDDIKMENKKNLSIFSTCVKDVDYAQNLVIIKTNIGAAMVVATVIDGFKNSSIKGCIAGDDTVFVATESTEKAIILVKNMKEMIRE